MSEKPKTDDQVQAQVQAEKDAVAKLIGAKSAMEKALKRIERLESHLKRCAAIAEDVAKKSGEMHVSTFYGPKREGSEIMRLSELMMILSRHARDA